MKIIIKKIIKKLQEIFTNNSKIISAKESEKYFFCFSGEFGYELISWIPYLLFIKKKFGLKINTISRPGSKIFYYFSDNHLELKSSDINICWGQENNYKKIKRRFNIKKMIYPSNLNRNEQIIKIGGYEWNNKNIHTKINEKNYEKIMLPHSNINLPFNTSNKFVVINNKYAKEWYEKPINFLSRKDLMELKNFLLKKGFFIVYNPFSEKTSNDEYPDLSDDDIFVSKNTYDMRFFYMNETCQEKRNEVQVQLYKKADFIIGVQGGNIYLPAICRKKIFMLMKKGDYIDYKELSRLYDTPIEVFYETKHMLEQIKNNLK